MTAKQRNHIPLFVGHMQTMQDPGKNAASDKGPLCLLTESHRVGGNLKRS